MTVLAKSRSGGMRPSPKKKTGKVALPNSRVKGRVICADNAEVLAALPDGCADLVYIDPPFNTGTRQERQRIRTVRDDKNGDRTGFQGRRYRTIKAGKNGYTDRFDDYLAFLGPRLEEAYRVLAPHGSLFVHLDCREVHYCKVQLDAIFGRDCFQNEIIWAYDYGGRSKSRWPAKHDNILWYTKDPKNYTFHREASDSIPYMAPALAGAEKAKQGKYPTDVWWHTIVPTNGKEKTGYTTQKPLGILHRIIAVHSDPGDLVLDFFAGSGTTGIAALELDRRFLLVDSSTEATAVMKRRFSKFGIKFDTL